MTKSIQNTDGFRYFCADKINVAIKFKFPLHKFGGLERNEKEFKYLLEYVGLGLKIEIENMLKYREDRNKIYNNINNKIITRNNYLKIYILEEITSVKYLNKNIKLPSRSKNVWLYIHEYIHHTIIREHYINLF